MTDTKSLREAATMAFDWIGNQGEQVYFMGGMSAVDAMNEVGLALRVALALPDEQIGWRNTRTTNFHQMGDLSEQGIASGEFIPVYAAPQPAEPKAAPVERKPLSSEVVFDLALDEIARTTDVVDLAFNLIRATEAKHDIKGTA